MRHITIAKLDYSGPAWLGGTPDEQGYRHLNLPKLKRHDSRPDEYFVYENEKEYKTVIAESAVDAVTESHVDNPVKVIHAHARIADVMNTSVLEVVESGEDAAHIVPDILAPVAAIEEEQSEEVISELTPEIQPDK